MENAWTEKLERLEAENKELQNALSSTVRTANDVMYSESLSLGAIESLSAVCVSSARILNRPTL